jgi:hypothetical protein
VFDISGSMQFDTACFGCYDIFRDGNRPWYNLDQPSPTGDPAFSNIFPNPAYINPIPVRHLPDKNLDGTTAVVQYGFIASTQPYSNSLPSPNPQNEGQLCWGRNSNPVGYFDVAGPDPARFVLIEAELYSLNTTPPPGFFRQPGQSYWAAQQVNQRTVDKMVAGATSGYLAGAHPSLPSYSTGSWVSHHPYVTWAILPNPSTGFPGVPFGQSYNLAEVRANPNNVPSLEYDFVTAPD